MHKNIQRILFAVLSVSLLSPVGAMAQTTDTTTATTTGTVQLYQEGPTEPGAVRQQRVRGYRQQSSELQQKINALGSSTTQTVFMPILFGVTRQNISPNFGDPRSGGRTHEGEDMLGVKGTPIVSPTAAVVLRTGVGATEGNYVYTANPGGETFVYMHLDRIGEGVVSGTVLAQGSLIGYVGDTGNALGGPAHLHFEIHNSSGAPVDPFPRITGEFSPQEKIAYLSSILLKNTDPTALARFLVTNFRSTFSTALAAGIALPSSIVDALASIPAGSTPTSSTGGTSVTLPPGDLELGSSGAMVVELQNHLIRAATGPAAIRLAGAGATGNFGPITEAALIEYQRAAGISPANGYYGAGTRIYIATHPFTAPQPLPPVTPTPPTIPPVTTTTFYRDLYRNIRGEDVRALQRLLNKNGYIVAAEGSGSLGNETDYFGPATEAAVIKLQRARGITPAAGYVGPITRRVLAVL